MAENLNVGEGNIADYIDLKRTMVELSKEKLIGRVVRGRLTQPIEEGEVGAAHLIQEKKAGEKKTIEALTSDDGEILTSEGQKTSFILDYFTGLYRLEVNKTDDLRMSAHGLASLAANDVRFESWAGQISFLY